MRKKVRRKESAVNSEKASCKQLAVGLLKQTKAGVNLEYFDSSHFEKV